MRLLAGLSSLCLAVLFAAAPAQAYTPESGTWWNPNEPGTGIFIEVQDNLLVAAAFVGDNNGNPIWYTSTNFLTGNARFDGALDLTRNVQCPGCPYNRVPNTQDGAGGTLRLVFDPNDNTKATLTWGNGRVVPYERYQFYLKRPEDPSAAPIQATKMLGEWQAVMDFSSSSAAGVDFYGDVIVFDVLRFNGTTGRYFYEGCRAANSEDGGCSNNALAFHSASGYYDAATGLNVIVVDDSTSQYALYLVETGTNAGQGEITVYPKGTNPSNYDAYPMRAFRTASRTFVEEGVGPSKQDAVARRGIGDQLQANGGVIAAKTDAASKYDRAALLPLIRELEQQLDASKQARAAR